MMFINSYRIEYSTTNLIQSIDRDEYMTHQFLKLNKEYIESINTIGNTALLYVAGPSIHHSDGRNCMNTTREGTSTVKSQIGYNVYNVGRAFKKANITYASSNANTCASSMHSLYEAKHLLSSGFTDVIIFGSDLVEASQLLLFEQLGADVTCGDGMVIIHITKDKTINSIAEINDVAWIWNRDRSPMAVSAEGYSKVIDALAVTECDVVKTHGTGTGRNNIEEAAALKGIVTGKHISYKSKIGHTQGISTALELCMLLEDEEIEWKTALVLASGLGGFYGGCTIRRV